MRKNIDHAELSIINANNKYNNYGLKKNHEVIKLIYNDESACSQNFESSAFQDNNYYKTMDFERNNKANSILSISKDESDVHNSIFENEDIFSKSKSTKNIINKREAQTAATKDDLVDKSSNSAICGENFDDASTTKISYDCTTNLTAEKSIDIMPGIYHDKSTTHGKRYEIRIDVEKLGTSIHNYLEKCDTNIR